MIKKFICIALGLISLGLGILGIILPVLPTVPFLLLTSFFFSKGSTIFNKWFISTKIYKKYLEGFVNNKIMTLKGELVLLISVSLMLFIAMWMVNNTYMSISIIILMILKFSYFIFFIETVSKEEYERRKMIC